MRPIVCLAACCLACAAAAQAAAAERDPQKLPVARVRDLHYGDVLFQLYQDESFEALVRLDAYAHWGRLPHHEAEAQLLLGGLYLSLGLHDEAGARFAKLLTPDVPAGARNRAWFYLGKVWYARGYYERAEQAMHRVQRALAPDLEAERRHLLANALLRQNRLEEAIAQLEGWSGPIEWLAYARYNLGVAGVGQGALAVAEAHLTAVGTLEAQQPELVSLRDRANLALGFAYLQADEPAKAKPVLERVRLNGPFSSQALLGVGWADAALGEYRAALGPWLELRGRDLLDAAVQEAFLAVPYAFGRLSAEAQAAEHYEAAIRALDAESARIDESIAAIRAGRLLERLLAEDAGTRHGWFWQLRTVPDAPELRYLYTLLAGYDFQEGLKNYRDLAYLDGRLGRWAGSMDAFENMIETRERAYAARLPRADALLASDGAQLLQARRAAAESRLLEIERTGEAAALGTAKERDQWSRILRLEAVLAGREDAEAAVARDKLRLAKGVLYWRLHEAFRMRARQSRRTLGELDAVLRETRGRWERVERARGSAPADAGEFAARLAALGQRLEATHARLARLRERQNEQLEALAVRELEGQKERLASYRTQARFALASIYDRAASDAAAAGGEAPPQSDDTPAPQSAPGVPR